MRPIPSTNNESNGCVADSKSCSKVFHGCSRPASSYFEYLRNGKFLLGVIVFVVVANAQSPLSASVGCIVGSGTKPKMFRVDARRIIPTWTVVAHFNSSWDSSVMNHPRNSVCASRRFSSAYSDIAISPVCFGRHPQPTGIGLFHLCPKSISESRGKSLFNHPLGRNVHHRLVYLPAVDSRSRQAFSL